MHRIFRVKAYEMEHGPHFNEEHARKAVMKMENEDGTRGPHWSLEETSALASQYGISLSGKFNRYDWFVALNMVYSDYYKVLLNITGSNNIKHYIEFAKAWLNDKDIDEGKMWYYYQYVMCDKIREAEMECYTVWAVMAAGGGSGLYCCSSVGVVMDLDLVVVMQVLQLLN